MLDFFGDYIGFVYDGLSDVGIGVSVWLVALALPFRPLVLPGHRSRASAANVSTEKAS